MRAHSAPAMRTPCARALDRIDASTATETATEAATEAEAPATEGTGSCSTKVSVKGAVSTTEDLGTDREARLRERETALERLNAQLALDFEYVLGELDARLDAKKAQLRDEHAELQRLQTKLDVRERQLQGREQTVRVL